MVRTLQRRDCKYGSEPPLCYNCLPMHREQYFFIYRSVLKSSRKTRKNVPAYENDTKLIQERNLIYANVNEAINQKREINSRENLVSGNINRNLISVIINKRCVSLRNINGVIISLRINFVYGLLSERP